MPIAREVQRCLGALSSQNAYLNAFTNVRLPESLMKEAALAGERLTAGTPLSPIDGKIIAVKDNICTDDIPTTCSSEMLREYTSPFAATAVKRLNQYGAIILGKTNMDEFGMGSHSINSAFGPVRRPKSAISAEEIDRSAGGSSGGSAAAVAARLCDGALGTDTGGSVRLPAAYCGVYGLKPSYGMISRWGVVAYSNSLDTVGILARDSTLVKNIFTAISGHDEHDPTSLTQVTRSRIIETIESRNSRRGTEPLTIGIPLEYNVSELSPSILAAWKHTINKLTKLGHKVKVVSLPNTKHALSTYYIIAAAEASSNLAKYDGLRYGARQNTDWSDGVLFANTRKTGFGDEVRRRILLGTYSLSATAMDNYFIQAQRVRRLIQNDFNSAFSLPHLLHDHGIETTNKDTSGVDVLLAPCSLSPAPPLADVLAAKSPLDAYVNDVLTVPASLAGIPALCIPVQNPSGDSEPLGMQLLAQFGDENALFEIAKVLE
ncbi:amidase signature domain-containing protein [Peziza echinospora]|nr:amidase signature domain-containing protein [Peziza echinospora]